MDQSNLEWNTKMGNLNFMLKKAEKEKEVPDDKRSMDLIQEVANSIDDMIQMTNDVPSNYNDDKVPMLDVKAWIEADEEEIYYEFYEKPTKSKFVMSKGSAMPLRKKMETLSQEVFRRLHNTKHKIEWEKKATILEKFMTELKMSGYSEMDRYQVLQSGIRRYNSLRKQEEEGRRPFFRKRSFQRNKRNDDKRMKKSSWFTKKDNKFSSVFFVPPTPNSKLLKMLKAVEEKHMIDDSSRIKFVEMGGIKYRDYFKAANNLKSECEEEENCMACKNKKNRIDCKASNIGYTIECVLCKERNIPKEYHGESSRNSFIRQKEHMKELKKKSKKSIMWKHIMNDHSNEKVNMQFQMKIIRKFSDRLTRQAEES